MLKQLLTFHHRQLQTKVTYNHFKYRTYYCWYLNGLMESLLTKRRSLASDTILNQWFSGTCKLEYFKVLTQNCMVQLTNSSSSVLWYSKLSTFERVILILTFKTDDKNILV